MLSEVKSKLMTGAQKTLASKEDSRVEVYEVSKAGDKKMVGNFTALEYRALKDLEKRGEKEL